MNPTYERRASMQTSLSVESVLDKLANGFKSAGLKVNVASNSVTITKGSNVMVRLFGTSLGVGRRFVPSGLTVNVSQVETGSHLDIHAYDRLGWFVDLETNKSFKDRSAENFEEFFVVIKNSLDEHLIERETP